MALALAACGGESSSTVSTSQSAAASESAVPSPSESIPPSNDGLDEDGWLDPGSFGEVTIGVPVFETRGDPGSTWTLIMPDTLVYVIELDRVSGSYHVEFSTHGGADVFGWIEAERDSRPVLRSMELSACPSVAPDVTWIAGMSSAERSKCFGDDPLTFQGYVVELASSGALYAGEPAWLANSAGYALVQNQGPALEGGQLELHFAPDTSGSAVVGGPVVITGHFDDSRANGCLRQATPNSAVPDQSEQESVLWCKQRFVVETVDEAD
ncbi:MAG TPA: hypothetical protein VFW95_10310 [Candidatus Limnocylindria bacterium]|nr:hypothetical protein [Candidatus Limnocylindria bacterium]